MTPPPLPARCSIAFAWLSPTTAASLVSAVHAVCLRLTLNKKANGMLVLLLLLTLSLAMDNGEFDHGGGGGGGGGPAAATVAAVATMEDDWRQKRPATKVLTVA